MAFIDLKFFSEALGMQTEAYVVIPQGSRAGEIGAGAENGEQTHGFKCLYLLHGLSDDETIWMRRTSIERYADQYGICVVMPDGARSFYCDMKYGQKWYTYVARELPARIREFLRVSDRREDNYVAGLSMGGYGALKIALRERDSFCAGAALSPAVDMVKRVGTPTTIPIFGENGPVPNGDDLFWLEQDAKDSPNRPRIFIGIGTEDGLYGETQEMRRAMEADGYDLTYRESAGTHNWAFWDEYIQYALEWMLKQD